MASGFDVLSFDNAPKKLGSRKLTVLEQMGFWYYDWLVGIQALPLRIASSFDIPLAFMVRTARLSTAVIQRARIGRFTRLSP